jgi:transposase InsO family protein
MFEVNRLQSSSARRHRSAFLRPRRSTRVVRSARQRISRRLRKKVEMLFAHLKRILKTDRLRLRGPNGARDEFLLAATAQNLRKLAKLIPAPNLQPA